MMHHFASSILSFFLSPFNWIMILLILSFLLNSKKHKKSFRIAALIIFILFSNEWLLSGFTKKWQLAPVEITQLNHYSCGIILGGFGSPDAAGNGYFNETSDRFIQAEKLYKLGLIQHILISGGNGKNDDANFREGKWARNEFISMGIPDSAIIVEDRSNDTYDNAVYAKHILDSMQFTSPYLLISSAFHLPRASLIFRNAGLNTESFPCNYTEGRGRFEWGDAVPKASVLAGWEPMLKEVAGYLLYAVFKKR